MSALGLVAVIGCGWLIPAWPHLSENWNYVQLLNFVYFLNTLPAKNAAVRP
jgi:hypothetical protein